MRRSCTILSLLLSGACLRRCRALIAGAPHSRAMSAALASATKRARESPPPLSRRVARLASPSAEPADEGERAAPLAFKGLRSEAARVRARAFKKVEKADARRRRAEDNDDVPTFEARRTARALSPSPARASSPPLANARRARASRARARWQEASRDHAALQERLARLIALDDGLAAAAQAGGARAPAFAALEAEARALEVGDAPPARPDAGAARAKKRARQAAEDAKRQHGPRRPYRTHASADGFEIRVGKSAADNDVLSLDRELCRADDWWLHASGCPGSHIVVRVPDGDDASSGGAAAGALPRETLLDACALAVAHSKAGKAALRSKMPVPKKHPPQALRQGPTEKRSRV